MSRSTVICISFVIVSLIFAGQSYAKVDPGTILGAWLLDEGSGNVALDASGNGNDGTILGSPAWVAGQSGTALRFTGSGTYVNCGNPEAFNINLFSVSFWYNFPATQSWNHMISRGQHVASGTPGSVNWGIMMYSAEQRILYETYNNTGWTAISADSTMGVWHHVVATFDGTTMQLYQDGQLIGTQGGGVLLDQSRPLIIGGRSDAGSVGGIFNGSLDEVGYFNIVLAPEDVQLLMKEGLGAVTGNPRARRPDPKDGAVHTATWVNLAWAPGDGAVSHDVYLGESFDDVNSGAAGTFRGNVATPFFTAGFFGVPYPDGLVPGTTYYWRIDEVNPADPNSPWKGKVWSFTIPPRKAYNPNPANGTKYVATDVALTWTGGLGTKLHYVYFGDNADTVSNATGGLPRGTATYTPAGPLAKGKTYYWRVDEFDGTGTYKGDVWSFTTLPDIPITNPDLIGWWKFDEGYGKKAIDFSGHANDGTLGGDPQWVEGVMDGALDLSGNDYVAIDGIVNDMTGTNITLSAWIKTTQTSEGELFAANDSASAHPVMFGIDAGNPYVNDGTDTQFPPAVNDDQWHMITYVRNGSAGTIYVDGVQVGTYAATWSKDTITRWSIGQEWDTATPSDFFNGAVDDARIYNKALTADEVKQLTRGDLLRAWNPSPPNWSTVGIDRAASLTWTRGDKASQHDVYFGLDKAAVTGAAASDTTGLYRGRQSGTSYVPPEGVQFSGGPYYWRVDEVNTDGTITTGALWSFSIAAYALVDDFESYNDIAAGQAGSNLVYMTWLDGFGTTTNGSTMGYPTGSSLETANVHGGTKAVPLIYNNATASFSEVERTFAAQNWTNYGIQTLSLWFCGAPANVPGQLYVKFNGVKVPYDGEAANLKKPIWQVWNITLASVGTNLQSVTKLAVGIETKGTGGTLLLDDIRLYPNARELITPVQPATTGLAARYAFDGNANDSAGGHNGTPNGGPTYVLGKIGQAISLDGLDDNVVVGNVGITGAAPRTIAGWAKMNVTTGIPDWTNIFGFSATGSNNLHFDIEVVGGTTTTTAGYYGVHVYGWERNIMAPDLEWHHFAASYDGTRISWYGDGLLAGSAAHPGLNTLGNVRIGNRQDNTNFFPGLVDEVQIYSRVLSEAEIAGLAGMTKPFDKSF